MRKNQKQFNWCKKQQGCGRVMVKYSRDMSNKSLSGRHSRNQTRNNCSPEAFSSKFQLHMSRHAHAMPVQWLIMACKSMHPIKTKNHKNNVVS